MLTFPNSYISKVDVLNILVAAAYRHVPSLDQILQPAAVTRLRNQLLEAEYYQLAVEVNKMEGCTLLKSLWRTSVITSFLQGGNHMKRAHTTAFLKNAM